MPQKSNLKKRQKKLEELKSLFNIIAIIISVFLFIGAIKIGIKIYNPQKKNYIKNTNLAYELIRKELNQVYKTQKYVIKSIEEDNVCELLGQKLSSSGGNCYNTSQNYSFNFKIKRTDIEILGLEKPAYNLEGNLVKDFIIDINGSKGENRFGVDRVPVRLYSTGRLGGNLSPINCSKDDEKDYYFYYSPICAGEPEINFMATNTPFGYDVMQIGGKKGVSNKLNRDIPFLRADCIAFGGELIAGEYCDAKGYSWLSACYHDYLCATELSGAKL